MLRGFMPEMASSRSAAARVPLRSLPTETALPSRSPSPNRGLSPCRKTHTGWMSIAPSDSSPGDASSLVMPDWRKATLTPEAGSWRRARFSPSPSVARSSTRRP
jgi:hypothetical protein